MGVTAQIPVILRSDPTDRVSKDAQTELSMSKTDPGNHFEDFRLGQVLSHATPRTITAGDVALYNALYGPRFALTSADEFARACGLPASRRPLGSSASKPWAR